MTATILWLAIDEARGHLMRAHLVRRLLANHDVQVDIATTGEAGARFLRAMGSPATVLPGGYGLCFDERHDFDPVASRDALRRYVVGSSGLLRDLREIRHWRRYDLVVDDSFHPALLLVPHLLAFGGPRIVHVQAEHLRVAIEHGLAQVSAGLFRMFRGGCRRAFASIEHGLHLQGPPRDGAIALPPLIAEPGRDRDTVRASLGIAPGHRLAVVYLNPRFRDPGLAEAIRARLLARGWFVHAVGEGSSGSPGWQPYDAALTDAIAAADLFVSGPGMGALAHVAAFGVPFVAMLSNQPEQVRNARDLARLGTPHRVVDLHRACWLDDFEHALLGLDAMPRPVPSYRFRPGVAHRAWARTFQRLLQRANPHLEHQPCRINQSDPTTSLSS